MPGGGRGAVDCCADGDEPGGGTQAGRVPGRGPETQAAHCALPADAASRGRGRSGPSTSNWATKRGTESFRARRWRMRQLMGGGRTWFLRRCARRLGLMAGGSIWWWARLWRCRSRNRALLAAARQANSLAIAPYLMHGVTQWGNDDELYGPLMAQPEQMSREGLCRRRRPRRAAGNWRYTR